MYDQIFNQLQQRHPLVHCITNYVTVNDCANILLACGGSPIMADDALEVEEITALCQALVINIGTLNERTLPSMFLAGRKANELNHPIILDPVGVGASTLRTETALRLIRELRFSVIRGNISEIKALSLGSGTTQGVDADEADQLTSDNEEAVITMAQALSRSTGAVIAITGATDLVVDETRALRLHNGNPMMSKVTGTGCMLSAMLGAYCGANPQDIFHSVTSALSTMGIAGEIAFEHVLDQGSGTGTYKMLLIDGVSRMTPAIYSQRIKLSKAISRHLRLYGVTDRSWTQGRTLAEQVQLALEGGATFIQLREKNLSFDDFLREAAHIKPIAHAHRVPFVINDNIEVALKVDADGVHIGQQDGAVQVARRHLGQHKIIGVSARTVEEALQAELDGADYIGVGAMFTTTTKADAASVTRETLAKICAAVRIPVVAIGGIDEHNSRELAGTGIHGIAVVSAIFSKPDVKNAAARMRRAADYAVAR